MINSEINIFSPSASPGAFNRCSRTVEHQNRAGRTRRPRTHDYWVTCNDCFVFLIDSRVVS
jgi:hypothetical protein